LTGSIATAGALTIVEPLCNMVAHYFFDRWWDGRQARREARRARASALTMRPRQSGEVARSIQLSQARA
jgi:uncharacterized membrane protein